MSLDIAETGVGSLSEPETSIIDINGFATRVWRKGTGPRIGFLAGYGGLPRWVPFLDRLAEYFQHMTAEFEHLVEKQHAVMREGDLAGPRLRSTADQRRIRDRVMRCAKRPLDD